MEILRKILRTILYQYNNHCYNDNGDYMENIKFNNQKYIIEKNIYNCFKYEEVEVLFTDYFDEFDYILGDYSYDKLRLKGFCKKGSSRFNKINDINQIDEYVKNYCSYQANYFLLKKVQ